MLHAPGLNTSKVSILWYRKSSSFPLGTVSQDFLGKLEDFMHFCRPFSKTAVLSLSSYWSCHHGHGIGTASLSIALITSSTITLTLGTAGMIHMSPQSTLHVYKYSSHALISVQDTQSCLRKCVKLYFSPWLVQQCYYIVINSFIYPWLGHCLACSTKSLFWSQHKSRYLLLQNRYINRWLLRNS